jgi:hypothetical protein
VIGKVSCVISMYPKHFFQLTKKQRFSLSSKTQSEFVMFNGVPGLLLVGSHLEVASSGIEQLQVNFATNNGAMILVVLIQYRKSILPNIFLRKTKIFSIF